MNITTNTRFGPLQEGFALDLPETGLVVLTGPNNAGKSAVLQLTFKTLMQAPGFGANSLAILFPERNYVQSSAETGGRQLEAYNNDVFGRIQGTVLTYEAAQLNTSELPRLLLNHSDYLKQVARLNSYLVRLGFSELALKGSQLVHFENVAVQFQGSGLRSIFTILTAVSDEGLRVILVDEPELALEPRLQKAVRDLMIDEAKNRLILISTHSHLFLQRQQLEANYVLKRSGDVVSISPVVSHRQLMDLTFELLGNDTEDLFFAGNYLVTEGASDQTITERVLELLGVEPGRVKVLAAGGIGKVKRSLTAITLSLVPIVVDDSPYADKVVAMIDKPAEGAKELQELGHHLGDRLFVLSEPSIEEYLPDPLYERAARNKADDIARIAELKSQLQELRKFKQELSQQLAAVLTAADLGEIPAIRDAAMRAAAL